MSDHRDHDVDVLVVGGGLMGAATAWAASRAGLSVMVVEQFAAGHRRGSSHGSARIVRRAYGDTLYTDLSGRALELWSELERDADVRVLRLLGGLDFGSQRDIDAIAARLAAVGAEHEVLDAAEAQSRWPGMRFAGKVVYHPEAGVLDADAAVTAFLAASVRNGAIVEHGVAVASLEPHGAGLLARLGDGREVRCAQLVVAAGAWAGPMLTGLTGTFPGLTAMPPLRVTQQQVFHFPRADPDAAAWPSVIHDDGHGVYHLAGGRDGGPHDDRKIGEHDRGKLTTATDRDGVVDPHSRVRVVEYVQRWLPGLVPTPREETTCLYTTTPSEDFVLDRVGPVLVCSACSGHGAKFAPLIGELVTAMVRGEDGVPDRFRLAAHAAARPGKVSL